LSAPNFIIVATAPDRAGGGVETMRGARTLVLLGCLVWCAPQPASAAGRVDLGAVVLDHIEGYTPAAPGIGLSGPLTDEQLAQLSPDVKTRDYLKDGRTYARTFVRTGGRQAVIAGFDFESVAGARAFLAGARESAGGTLGTVVPVPGLEAFRVAVRPEKANNRSAQEVFLRSGPLGFVLALTDKPTAPVTDADVVDLALAQASAVPADVAATKDSAKSNPAYAAGYAVGQIVGVLILVGIVVSVVTATRRRRSA
jgi:hypothetical protein